jgi:NADH-quinone oxidoreductase subunit N
MVFYILAAITMTLGNLLALLQDNLKRLLAYSSVAHAGYMLIGLAVAPYLHSSETQGGGVDAVLFYLVSYGAMTVGAFAVIAHLSTPQRPVETVDDLAGLSQSRPGVALSMALFLFSLIGLPPLPGFWGKFLLFSGALLATPPGEPGEESHPWLFKILALIGALNAAVGAWYYLRIVAVMYLRGGLRPAEKNHSLPGLATLWLCALVTLALIYPWPLVNAAHQAVTARPGATVAQAGR